MVLYLGSLIVRFFKILLDAIKKLSAKLASITLVDTRKATGTDRDQVGETSSPAEVRRPLSVVFQK